MVVDDSSSERVLLIEAVIEADLKESALSDLPLPVPVSELPPDAGLFIAEPGSTGRAKAAAWTTPERNASENMSNANTDNNNFFICRDFFPFCFMTI